MPHITIEHSSNFSTNGIAKLFPEIQNIMASIKEGNFDLEQCKARAVSFDEYLVGSLNQNKSAFLHITIKILAGRAVEVRQRLAKLVMEHLKRFFGDFIASPTGADQIIAVAEQVADLITGTPNVAMPMQNSELANKRCDLSVDIVEMDRETYQKERIGD